MPIMVLIRRRGWSVWCDAVQTERAWASKIIRGQVEAEQLPGVNNYLAAVRQRRQGTGRAAAVTAATAAAPFRSPGGGALA
jgi:hypothetical protein